MIDTVIRRLERFAPLSADEKLALRNATSGPVQRLPAHHDLVRQGEPPGAAHLLLLGFACRYCVLPDGRRQIMAYLIPGDICALGACMLERTDHSIGTIGPVEITQLARERLVELTEHFPQLTRALWRSTLVEEATTREWMLNVGHRTALARTAHLFCELFSRLHAAGLTSGNACELPVTQSDLADALALTTVHVNRTLMEMRRRNLITFRHRHLTVHDFGGLQSTAGFAPGYLHLNDPSPFGAEPPAHEGAGRAASATDSLPARAH